MRATARLADASFYTVAKLMLDASKVCADLHDELVQCDEIWSFTYAKHENVATAKNALEEAGDTWTWTALDSESKLIIGWLVGGRDGEYTMAFMDGLRSRLANRVQLTTDGHRAYLEAVEGAFAGDVDYAQLVKLDGEPTGSKGHERKYSPSESTGVKTRTVKGNPDKAHIFTSHVERQNLTMRLHMRRFTRLTNAFSKKFNNHVATVSLYTMFYSFGRIHETLRVSPAMEARLTDRVWDMEDIIAIMDERAPKPGPRGSYKKRSADFSD